MPPHCDSQADTTVHTLNSSLNTTKTIRSLTQSYKSAQNELDVSGQISYTVYVEKTFCQETQFYLLREFLDPLTILPGCLMIHSRSHALNNRPPFHYSRGSNSERSKSEPIRNPNLFLLLFRMVPFSNGRFDSNCSDFEWY